MAIFRSLKTLISQSLGKHSSSSPSRAFFSISSYSASPIPSPFLLPSNGYIRRHFLFRSGFLLPVRGPLFLVNPPWKLSQSATPLLLQSDVVLNFLKLRALNLLQQPAFPHNFGYDAGRLLSESGGKEFGCRDQVDASISDGGISDSYLNLPNCISITRLLSGPLLGWWDFNFYQLNVLCWLTWAIHFVLVQIILPFVVVVLFLIHSNVWCCAYKKSGDIIVVYIYIYIYTRFWIC